MKLPVTIPNYLEARIGTDGWDLNCWGATKSFFTDEQDMGWIDREEMEEWLESFTSTCNDKKELKHIVVLRTDDDRLLHTAVYVGNDLYLQKRGSNMMELVPFDGVFGPYKKYGAKKIEYREVKL